MEQKKLYANIFTPEAREHLLKMSGPKSGEIERVKKDIFEKLETRYPQFKRKPILSVNNFIAIHYAFGFALIFVLLLSGYEIFNINKGNKAAKNESVVYNPTITPSQTELAQLEQSEREGVINEPVYQPEITKSDSSTVTRNTLSTPSRVKSNQLDSVSQKEVNKDLNKSVDQGGKKSTETIANKSQSLSRIEGSVIASDWSNKPIYVSETQVEYPVMLE